MSATVHYLNSTTPTGQISAATNRCGSIDLMGSEDILEVTCSECLRVGPNPDPKDKPLHYIHNGVNWRSRNSRPYMCGAQAVTDVATTDHRAVSCTDCLALMGRSLEKQLTLGEYLSPEGVGATTPQDAEKLRRQWTVAAVGGDTDLGFADWKRAEGVGGSTLRRHKPPRMEDERGLTDGVFIFYGTHSDLGGEMEVVPMTTGNVEFTISTDGNQSDGLVFNLSHLDRADLIRALLHDFHYSPERGGPHVGD